ncbi:MAG: adenylate/guanylate cyclase domain-containing protein [Hyphomicrobium sp.]|uniref:adenylate/guanylate cyclase domain-containing protein n=1 Tax=Hyphomicrobium sp. TaxID=82 RepID=UPI0039E39CD8
MKRKIAAILAADIVGYSKLVGDDEEETLGRLANYRAVFGDFITRFGGRIFNTAGDAILAEFASAVDAVRCAVDTQESLRTRNLAYPPSRQMNFRIGITIGDVVEREGDLLGEGVNIASRLEGIAPVGGICVSRSVHEAVANKISLKFADVGEQQLKNLPDRIHAYTVSLEQLGTPKAAGLFGAYQNRVWRGAAAAAVAALGLVAFVALRHNATEGVSAAAPVAQPKPPQAVAQASPAAATIPDTRPTANTNQTESGADRQLAGEWKGIVGESGGRKYNVDISLQSVGKGTVSYPDVNCTGTLEYLLRRGPAYVFREKITKGSTCGRTAEIELTVAGADGATLDYKWIGQGPTMTGRVSGEMSEAKDCMRYLPNLQAMVPAVCKAGEGPSSGADPAAPSSVDIDPATLGAWVLTVPRGHWIWVTRDNGTYDFHSEASDGAPSHHGRFDASNGKWSIQATSGYTDGGSYEVLPSGAFVATGRLGTGEWEPAYPVTRVH